MTFVKDTPRLIAVRELPWAAARVALGALRESVVGYHMDVPHTRWVIHGEVEVGVTEFRPTLSTQVPDGEACAVRNRPRRCHKCLTYTWEYHTEYRVPWRNVLGGHALVQ